MLVKIHALCRQSSKGRHALDYNVAPNLESNPNKAAYHITAVVRALSSMPVTQLTVNR